MNTTVSLCGATQLERIARQHPTHWHIAKLANWLICLLIFAACSKDSGSDPAPAPLPGNQPKDWAVPPVIKAGETHYISFCYTTGDRRFFVRFTGEGWADLNNNGLQDDDEKTRRSDGTTEIYYLAQSPTVTFYGNFRTFALERVNAIDVSHYPALQELRIDSRYLTQLDLRNNTDLAVLELLDMEHLTALDLSKNTNLFLVDISKVENFSIAQKEALVQSLPQKSGTIVLSRFNSSEGDANNQKVLDLIGAKKWIAKHRHKTDEEKLLPFNGKLYPYIKTIDLGWATNPNIDTEEKYYLTLYTQLSKGEKFKFIGDSANWIDLNNNGQQDKGEAIENDSDKEKSFVVDSPVITIYSVVFDLNISNNKIKAVDASHLRYTQYLNLSDNTLTQLILNENMKEYHPDFRAIGIMNNQLSEATMEALVKSLPPNNREKGIQIVLQYNEDDPKRSNKVNLNIRKMLVDKGWAPRQGYLNYNWPYK